MATTKNTLYKVKASPVSAVTDLNLEGGAIVFDLSDSKIKGCDGTVWAELGGGGGTTYTFQNGLTESGGVVELGGTLGKDTIVYGLDTWDQRFLGTPQFVVETKAGVTVSSSRLSIQDNIASLTVFDNPNTTNASFTLWPSTAAMKVLTASGEAGYYAYTPGLMMRDTLNNKGAFYDGDYEANFVARSLVTKQWVEANFVAI